MGGTVLLIAGAPVGRGRLVEAAGVLPVLSAVAPGVLAGAESAHVVELADPLEPQAVLTRLRAAAAAPDPLTLFVAGQLQLDRRQRLPHLALARTTPATVRYTAFPWHWFREELRLRTPGSTTLLLDLHADPECWQHLGEHPLDLGGGHAVYGRIAPPPGRRSVGQPSYMRAVATILRSGYRPPLEQLHQQALARIAEESEGAREPGIVLGVGPEVSGGVFGAGPGVPGGVFGGVPGGVPGGVSGGALGGVSGGASGGPLGSPSGGAPGGDPHSALADAVRAGRHRDADTLAERWEQAAVRAHGAGSGEALHWAEVRADLAMLAGDPVRSCRTWLTVAAARLGAGEAADAPAVEAAVDRAHHQWGCIRDTTRARELGPALAELRGRVPGRRAGALDHVRRQLAELQGA
ncbi:hypothetical protein AB0O01_24750 [Streptomyces sp. NPDC093252]|uniref:hypothetical protein n=1 Tax=Streptomyces sp. NPDC093252 TaxID=3154980 RepID=UPI00343AF413